jgi:hypothetical protein
MRSACDGGRRLRARLPALVVSLALCAGTMVLGAGPAFAGSPVTFRAATSAANGNDTRIKVKLPADVGADDVMLAAVATRGDADVTPPDGWTLVREDGNTSLYVRVAGDAEPSSYMWALSTKRSAVAAISAYQGADTANPVLDSSGQFGDKSTSLDAPSVYAAAANVKVVGFFRTSVDTEIKRPTGGWQERTEVSATEGKDISLEVSDFVQDEAGDTGDKAATANDKGTTSAQLVVLKSADPAPDPDPQPEGTLSVDALDSHTARLQWADPPGAETTVISREGRLLDEFPSAASTTYTDYLLWKSSSYTYDVEWLDGAGASIDRQSRDVTTPSQSGSFPVLYDGTSFWNQPIPKSPAIDPGSDAMVDAALVPYEASSNVSNDDAWGIPVAYAAWPSEVYSVACTRYDCNTPVSSRISKYASVSTGSDHHLAVIDASTDTELDMWLGSHDAKSDAWSAGSRYLSDVDGWGALCAEGQHCHGANAAGFSLAGGILRPEEIAQGHIDHALVFTTPFTRSGVIACPATATDGKYDDPTAIPEGARIQLDPSVDVDAKSWPKWMKVIARALQDYGAYLVDTGGSLSIRAESDLIRGYDAWSKAGIDGAPYLADLPWSKFRVLKITSC